MAPQLSFQVLGPLRVSVDGRPLRLRSARQRTVLAVLLLTPGRAVSVDTLADAVWHSDPPVTARNQIAICVSALRKTFRDEAGVDVDQLTDKVIRAIDRRIVAYRERTARS